jgi:hypothetical protein
VKEFRFNRDSEIVTVVFGDDQAQDFKGSETYKEAHIAAANAASVFSADLGLVDDKGAPSSWVSSEERPTRLLQIRSQLHFPSIIEQLAGAGITTVLLFSINVVFPPKKPLV